MPARLAVKGQQYPPEERMPMPFKTPPQISEAAVVSGAAKAVQRWDKVLVGGFLAGATSPLAACWQSASPPA